MHVESALHGWGERVRFACMSIYYFDDFHVGQTYEGGSHLMTKEEIIRFAREFDPQPQHIDEEAAKDSQFGELVASGWHTGGIAVRMKLESPMGQVQGGLAGLGIEAIRWPRPVRPGDTLSIRVTILETRVSQSKPDKGILRYLAETLNQHGEVVMELTTAALVNRRPS